MPHQRLNEQLLGTTRGRVVQLLRRGERSVGELAEALDVTPNAVRSHLRALEDLGFVTPTRKRPAVRRPETLYALTLAAEALFPKAYGLLLKLLLDAIARRLPPQELEALLVEIGHQLAPANPPASDESLRERTERAAAVLHDLGGLPEVEEHAEGWRIRGLECPLAALGAGRPEVCLLAEALLTEAAGIPVRARCETAAAPRRCLFEVGAA